MFENDPHSAIDERRIKRLLELSTPITVSQISQSHIQRRVDNKYRNEEAEELMNTVVKISLGDIVVEEYQAGKVLREKKILSKRKEADLTEDNKQLLKRMKVDMEKFNQWIEHRNSAVKMVQLNIVHQLKTMKAKRKSFFFTNNFDALYFALFYIRASWLN